MMGFEKLQPAKWFISSKSHPILNTSVRVNHIATSSIDRKDPYILYIQHIHTDRFCVVSVQVVTCGNNPHDNTNTHTRSFVRSFVCLFVCFLLAPSRSWKKPNS